MALFETKANTDKKYSLKVDIPQYLPSKIKPKEYQLYNTSKYKELLTAINTADIPEQVKEFLRLGATRHIVFDYAKIADYYAHAEPDVQRLMEQSALVIVDIDDAIANGFVQVQKQLAGIIHESRKEYGKC